MSIWRLARFDSTMIEGRLNLRVNSAAHCCVVLGVHVVLNCEVALLWGLVSLYDLLVVLSSALEFSSCPPVSVCGTVLMQLKLSGFSWKRGISYFRSVDPRHHLSALRCSGTHFLQLSSHSEWRSYLVHLKHYPIR